jgi:hypothetical protein
VISRIPDQVRKYDALAILKIAKEIIDLTPELEALARKQRASGRPIKPCRFCYF